jgi:hypothetical protein
LSWWRINRWSLHNSPRLRFMKSVQHLHAECLINSGPFGYKFKVHDTRDVEKSRSTLFWSYTLTSVASLTLVLTINRF